MCGIAGIVETRGRAVDELTLSAMTDTLHHRGPDAAGTFIDRNVGLGHRRLSIIDLDDTASQPLFNEDGTVAVVFNGEIYNFRELRLALQARGHVFRTRTDSEAIVHAWEEYGTDCIDHFVGMFSFGVYDQRSRQLFLARDRLGQKPLFYHLRGNRFVFGSEIKAVRYADTTGSGIDIEALAEYVAYGNSLGERTIFQGVRKLPPAHWMLLDVDREPFEPRMERYWEVSFEPEHGVSEDEWLERIDAALDIAVRRRLVSDVPLGAFLSGGVDSSLVTAFMARHLPRVKTFSIGFRESSHDESPQAELVARHLGTDHHCEYVTPDVLRTLTRLVEACDEPFADSSAIPTYYLSGMAREHVTVALSGDGGDETHSGYDRYGRAVFVDGITRCFTPLGRSAFNLASRAFPVGGRTQYLLDALSRRGADVYDLELGWNARHLSLLRQDVITELPEYRRGLKQADDFQRCSGIPFASRLQYVDLANYLVEDILVKVDRASMAHSLEVRCPLLDHEFVELSARIPDTMHRRGNQGKRLLKRLAERHVPREVLYRPKKGFGTPLGDWFRRELRPVVEDMLADSSARIWDYFDIAEAHRCFGHHLTYRRNGQSALWRLLFFHYWAEQQCGKVS